MTRLTRHDRTWYDKDDDFYFFLLFLIFVLNDSAHFELDFEAVIVQAMTTMTSSATKDDDNDDDAEDEKNSRSAGTKMFVCERLLSFEFPTMFEGCARTVSSNVYIGIQYILDASFPQVVV